MSKPVSQRNVARTESSKGRPKGGLFCPGRSAPGRSAVGGEIHVVANAQDRCDTLNLKKRVETIRLGKFVIWSTSRPRRSPRAISARITSASPVRRCDLGCRNAPSRVAARYPRQSAGASGCRDQDGAASPRPLLPASSSPYSAARGEGLGSDLMPIDENYGAGSRCSRGKRRLLRGHARQVTQLMTTSACLQRSAPEASARRWRIQCSG